MDIKRDTNTELMNNVFSLLEKNGHYEKVKPIIDYFLPETYNVKALTHYQFTFLTNLSFGGSEGIYLDCYIMGVFDENSKEQKKLSCGTFKTLDDNLEAMQLMGELAGSLTFYANQYVNQEIDKYTPKKQAIEEERRRKEREAAL